MFRSISSNKFSWRNSKAHLLLLSQFVRGRPLGNLDQQRHWKEPLQEDYATAIKRFVDEDMLQLADIATQLDFIYKASELKEMLKQRGLSTTGRKENYTQRLAEADPSGMQKLLGENRIYICTEQGKKVAEQYLTSEDTIRNTTHRLVLGLVSEHKFERARSTIASYEASQVFPRGLGINWKDGQNKTDIEILDAIFSSRPKCLSKLNEEKLEALRIAAAMIQLLGTGDGQHWLPANFETDLPIAADIAVRLVHSFGVSKAMLAGYKRSGVVKAVQILAARESCESCLRLAGKNFALDKAPELPHEHCTHKLGCRCTYLPIV